MNILSTSLLAVLLVAITTTIVSAQQQQQQNNTDVDAVNDVIETILANGRQGRNSDGFDDVYSDPTIQEAIQAGDDVQARNLIKDKLCSLGLMQCDDIYLEGKRPQYLSPEDLIYAQPIAIRPIGRPIASVPVRGGPPPSSAHRGPYGPPKPMPINSNGNGQNYGPPRKVGYAGPPSKQYFSGGPPGSFSGGPPGSFSGGPPGSFSGGPPGSFSSGPPGSFSSGGPPGSFSSGPPGSFSGGSSSSSYSGSFSSGGGSFLSKPPGPIYESDSPPYEFDAGIKQHHGPPSIHAGSDKPTIVVNAQGGAATTSGGAGGVAPLQQHIHHHYHHGEGDSKIPTVIVNNPSPVPVANGNGLISGEFTSSGFQGGSSSSLGGGGGFNGYGYKGQKNFESSGIGGPVNGITGSGVYGGGISSGFTSSGNSISAAQSALFSTGVKPVFESAAGNSGGNLGNLGPATFGANGGGNGGTGGLNTNAGASSSFGYGTSTKYGQSVSGVYNGNTGSFHSSNPDFYKKELNINGGLKANGLSQYQTSQNKYTQNGQQQFNTGEKYQGFESARQENFDCVCVPYEQCPAQDIIGRKDDLILPLDPRNLGSDIEAISDDPTVNGTTIKPPVRVTKDTNDNKKIDDDDASEKKVSIVEAEKKEEKKITKRDVSEVNGADQKADEAQQGADVDVEPVSFFYFVNIL